MGIPTYRFLWKTKSQLAGSLPTVVRGLWPLSWGQVCVPQKSPNGPWVGAVPCQFCCRLTANSWRLQSDVRAMDLSTLAVLHRFFLDPARRLKLFVTWYYRYARDTDAAGVRRCAGSGPAAVRPLPARPLLSSLSYYGSMRNVGILIRSFKQFLHNENTISSTITPLLLKRAE